MIQFNKSCYCKSQLTKYNNPGGFECRNCAVPISNEDEYLYPCFNAQCLYRQISTQSYIICSECYHSSDNEYDSKIDSTATDFIYKKFSHSLNIIS